MDTVARAIVHVLVVARVIRCGVDHPIHSKKVTSLIWGSKPTTTTTTRVK